MRRPALMQDVASGPARAKRANNGSGGLAPIKISKDAEISIYSYSNHLWNNNFDLIFLM